MGQVSGWQATYQGGGSIYRMLSSYFYASGIVLGDVIVVVWSRGLIPGKCIGLLPLLSQQYLICIHHADWST